MNQRIKDRINQLKSGQVPEGYEKTSFGVFPVDWEKNVKLKSICEFCGGGTPSTKKISFWNGNIPWVSSSDLIDNNINKIKISRFINKEAIQNSATKLCPKGSLLIVSRVGVGKLAVTSTDICTSQDFTNIIKTNCNILFLAYLLSKRIFIEINKMQGTSIKGLSSEEIKKIKIAYPKSQTEQAKIAEILMKWDEAIEAQEQLINKLEIRKKALMQKLLNPINNNYSLDYLLQNKHLRLIKPKELGEFLGNRFYLSTSSIIYDKIVSNEGIISYHYRPSRAQMKPINKSVWFAKMKNSIKVMLASKKDENTYVLSTGFYGFIANEKKINNMFLKQIFLSEKFNIQKDNYAEGSSQNGIKDNNLSDIYIPLPNINEQKRIANILSLADKGIELHKQQLEQLTKQRKSMMQLLLTGIVRTIDNGQLRIDS